MNTKLKRLLLPLLRAAAKGGPMTFRMKSAASQALFLLGKATSKSNGGRLRRIQKRTAQNEETKAIREAVFRRAEDQCEAWLAMGEFWKRCGRPAVSMDHWLGGSGRRRWGQTVDTCWALCGDHDRERTHNIPSAEHWNAIHRLHCQRHDYFFVPHIVHAQLKRSAP